MAKVFRVTKLDSTLIEKYNLIERAIKGGNYYKALKILNEAIRLIKDDSIKKFIVAVNDENYSFLEMVLQREIGIGNCNNVAIEIIEKLLILGAEKEHMLYYNRLVRKRQKICIPLAVFRLLPYNSVLSAHSVKNSSVIF